MRLNIPPYQEEKTGRKRRTPCPWAGYYQEAFAVRPSPDYRNNYLLYVLVNSLKEWYEDAGKRQALGEQTAIAGLAKILAMAKYEGL